MYIYKQIICCCRVDGIYGSEHPCVLHFTGKEKIDEREEYGWYFIYPFHQGEWVLYPPFQPFLGDEEIEETPGM